MKTKRMILVFLIIALGFIASYYYVNDQKAQREFSEMQISVGSVARVCKHYIINTSIEDDSKFQKEMLQAYGRLSSHIYQLIDDNKYIDFEYKWLFYVWLEDLQDMLLSDVDDNFRKNKDLMI